MNINKNQFVKSVLIGTYTAVIFVVIITIAGELYKVTGVDGKTLNPIKETLKAWHGHHWVGKGVWTVIVFLATSGIAYLINRKEFDFNRVSEHTRSLVYTLVGGTVLLYAFFIYEYIIHH